MPEDVAKAETRLRAITPDGVAMQTFPAIVVGIPSTDKRNTAWLERPMTSHPLKSWLDKISLNNGGLARLRRSYIHCTDPVLENSSMPAIAAEIRSDETWVYHELKTGHDAMITAPEQVTVIHSKLSTPLQD